MISLERAAPPGLEEPVEEPVEQEPEQAEQAAEEDSESVEQEAEPEIVEPEPPAPKRRGRPNAEPATPKKNSCEGQACNTKGCPKDCGAHEKPPVVYESSSEDDMPINREDMDTMLLSYLLQRKHAQQDHRRTMWAQMARLS